MEFQANLPYPEININEKNLEYAKILLFPYSGNVSEESAVHQYSYQAFINEGDFKDILENISIVEMRHLEILALMIKKLGLDPKFRVYNYDNKELFWNSEFINYPKTILETLDLDIENETKAIKNYKKIIELIPNKNIQEVINRIILDEEIHLTIFKNLKEKYEKTQN